MRRLQALALVAVAAAVQAPTAAAGPCGADSSLRLTPCDAEVIGGEGWSPTNLFSLRWRIPPQNSEPPVVAVHYRLRDATGALRAERRLGWAAESIDDLLVPLEPGAYSADLWLEDAGGALGMPVRTMLRFDDARPGPARVLSPPGWIGRAAFPYALRLEAPIGPQPVSGIRGYAVSIDGDREGDPCRAERCDGAEIDLLASGDAALPLTALLEGTSYVHAVAVSGSGMKSAVVAHAALRVDLTDPRTALSGVPGGWTNRPVRLLATASDAASGMSPTDRGPQPFTAIRVDGGAPIVAPGRSVEATVVAPGVHTVAYFARDAAGNVDDGATANGASNPPPAATRVRIDVEPPELAFAGAQAASAPERIEALVSDSQSGPDPRRGEIAVRPAGSPEPFDVLPTRRVEGALVAHWDSDAERRGRYEFRAIAFDRAGNAARTGRRANGSAMTLVVPLKSETAIRVDSRPAGVLSSGTAVALHGQLTAGRRTPLAGMPVRVVERFDAGSPRPERVSIARTGGGGEFHLSLPPGPSRTVLAAFAGTTTLSRSHAPPQRLAVHARVRLGASAPFARVGGHPIVFRGRVLAAAGAIPAGGKHVQLQFRLPGQPWSEFRTVRTDLAGRFAYAYRFSDDDSRGVRFLFRAYAPAQGDWPYEAGASRPVAVRGR